MRPGDDPFGALAKELNKEKVLGSRPGRLETLARSSRGCIECVRPDLDEKQSLLLVVDQFEEIFRFCRESEAAGANERSDAFVKLLLESVEQEEVPIYVVLTMRSDYLGDCAVFHGLPEALNEAQYLVPVLTREQLREVIKAPVESAGAEIAPELVQRLLNDVGHGLAQELDQLPVLQHTLMRTWQLSLTSGSLQLTDYERVGRMSGALDQHADELYEALSSDRQATAKRVFQRLSEKETAGRDIRRQTGFAELREVTRASAEELSGVLRHFEAFLASSGRAPFEEGSTIDITHEALIREWVKLKGSKDVRGWAAKEAEAAKVYMRLAEAARRDAAPWRDPDLTEALALNKTFWNCAGSAGTGERALRVSVDAALRAGIFKASGSIDPIGFGDERERGLPRPWSSSR